MQKRIALVTGAGRGIGRSIAIQLAKDGVDVAVTSRTESELDEVVSQIQAAGVRGLKLVGDMENHESLRGLVAAVSGELGSINVLVNNAGIGSSSAPQPFIDFDDEFWHKTMSINVTAPYLLSKAVLPSMVEANWGRIINIASINSKVSALHGAAYAVSKHALGGLTKSVALEHAQDGITVNAVCPGVTATKMNDDRIYYDVDRTGTSFEDIETGASLLGRRILPDEIADMAVYLARDEARAVTGQLINVCGGRLMGV